MTSFGYVTRKARKNDRGLKITKNEGIRSYVERKIFGR
jgi:hypothetical protein